MQITNYYYNNHYCGSALITSADKLAVAIIYIPTSFFFVRIRQNHGKTIK